MDRTWQVEQDPARGDLECHFVLSEVVHCRPGIGSCAERESIYGE